MLWLVIRTSSKTRRDVIIILHEYLIDKTGGIEKRVTCEACGTRYVYNLKRTAEGYGSTLFGLHDEIAHQRALDNAESELAKTLDNAVEIRPCPTCGHLQSDMVRAARQSRYPWLAFQVAFTLLLVLWIVGSIAFWCANPMQGRLIHSVKTWLIGMGLIAAGILTMPIVRAFLVMKYDPNAESEEVRRRRGVHYVPGIPLVQAEQASVSTALTTDAATKSKTRT
jgi:hypothetical protein